MFETKGRKNTEVYVDGGLYIAKRPVHFNKKTTAIIIPKDWIDSVSMGRELKWFLLDVRQTDIIVKPYFEDLPLEV